MVMCWNLNMLSEIKAGKKVCKLSRLGVEWVVDMYIEVAGKNEFIWSGGNVC